MVRRIGLPARDPQEQHRVSTPLELLFDLVVVIAISALTSGYYTALSAGHGGDAIIRFLILFVGIWWAWMGVTWFASAFGHEDAGYKLLLGTIMTGALIFAAGGGWFFETMDLSWGLLGWSIMRIALAILWIRVAVDKDQRRVALRFAASILIAQAAWFVMYFSTIPASPAAYVAAVLCFALELLLPVLVLGRGILPWHPVHLAERYGLLMLIMLGEGLLAASYGFRALYGPSPDFHTALLGFSGVVIVFTLWWVYFDRDHVLDGQFGLRTYLWGYGHAPLFAAVALSGAGVAYSCLNPQIPAGWALGGPLSASFLLIWLLRDRRLALSPVQMAVLPAAACAFALGGAAGQGAMTFAAISACLLAARILFFRNATHRERNHD